MAALINKYPNKKIKSENINLSAGDLANFLQTFKAYIEAQFNSYFHPSQKNPLRVEGSFKVVKRHRIKFNYDRFPDFKWAGEGERDESFAEIINQMATIETMILVLNLPENKKLRVIEAHPTQTSNPKGSFYNNDLVLEDIKTGLIKVIEISDTVSKLKDGNDKFRSDIKNLKKIATKLKKKEKKHEYYICCSSELWGIHQRRSESGNAILKRSGRHNEWRGYFESKIKDQTTKKLKKEIAYLKIEF